MQSQNIAEEAQCVLKKVLIYWQNTSLLQHITQTDVAREAESENQVQFE